MIDVVYLYYIVKSTFYKCIFLLRGMENSNGECPDFITDGPGSFSACAWESFFVKLPFDTYNDNRVNNTGGIITKESLIVPGANGDFAGRDFKKGECIDR